MPRHDISPCMGCSDRKSPCWDTCNRYREWKSFRDAVISEMRSDQQADGILINGAQKKTLKKKRRK